MIIAAKCVLALYLALQLLLPGGYAIAGIWGWSIALTKPSAYAALIAALSAAAVLTTALLRSGRSPGLCADLSLPAGLLNAVMLALEGHPVPAAIIAASALVMRLLHRKGSNIRPRLRVISAILAAALSAVLLFSLPGVRMSAVTFLRSIPSPDGQLTAEVTDVDQGALSGSTLVCVRKPDVFGVSVSRLFTLERTVWQAGWGIGQSLQVTWTDADTLCIDGTEYTIR